MRWQCLSEVFGGADLRRGVNWWSSMALDADDAVRGSNGEEDLSDNEDSGGSV